MPFLLFFFHPSGDHRDLHSFPTRRSSDLALLTGLAAGTASAQSLVITGARIIVGDGQVMEKGSVVVRDGKIASVAPRSEEHTSELQSQFHLVCRLLLEKKKKKTRKIIIT